MTTTTPTTATAPVLTPKEINAKLRAAVTRPNTWGLEHTLACTLISHWRGKIHCRTYRLYQGGWRTFDVNQKARTEAARERTTPKLQRVYGNYAAEYLGRAEIRSLDEQAEFIRRYIRCIPADLQPIAQAILDAPPRKVSQAA